MLFSMTEILSFKQFNKKGVINLGLFRKKHIRADEDKQFITSGNDLLLEALLDDEVLSKEEALNIPSLAGGIDRIASIVSMVQMKLYKKTENSIVEIADERLSLINNDNNDGLTGVNFKRELTKSYLLNGNAYAYINQSGTKYTSLNFVDEKYVSVLKNVNPIFKIRKLQINGQEYEPFKFLKVVNNSDDGVSGKGILDTNKRLLSVAYNSLKFEENLVKSGGNKKGFLKSQKKLTQEAIDTLKRAWRKLYKNNSENVVVLNDGLEFQESSNTCVELQLNEGKQANKQAIYDLLHLPIDDNWEKTIRYAVSPVLDAIESACNKDLLREKEKGILFFAFDRTDINKASIKERYEAYKMALDANFLQLDEVRAKENLPSLDFNYVKIGLSDVLYNPKTQEIYTPNTNKLMKMDGGEKLED